MHAFLTWQNWTFLQNGVNAFSLMSQSLLYTISMATRIVCFIFFPSYICVYIHTFFIKKQCILEKDAKESPFKISFLFRTWLLWVNEERKNKRKKRNHFRLSRKQICKIWNALRTLKEGVCAWQIKMHMYYVDVYKIRHWETSNVSCYFYFSSFTCF